MLISQILATALNNQIGHEFGASMQYVSIAAHFSQKGLTLLAKLFMTQAEEERQHAQKFVQYVLDTKAALKIPAIPAPKATFSNAEEAVEAALNWEKEVTRQITALPNLKRVLMPEDWVGYPLRKDYVSPDFYELQDAH